MDQTQIIDRVGLTVFPSSPAEFRLPASELPQSNTPDIVFLHHAIIR
jgi:hypothetical protein